MCCFVIVYVVLMCSVVSMHGVVLLCSVVLTRNVVLMSSVILI